MINGWIIQKGIQMKINLRILIILAVIGGFNPLYCNSNMGKTVNDNPTVTVEEMLEMIDERDIKTFIETAEFLNDAQIDNLYGNLSNELKLDNRDLDIQQELISKNLIQQKDKRFSIVAEKIILLQGRVNMYQRKLVYLSTLKKN